MNLRSLSVRKIVTGPAQFTPESGRLSSPERFNKPSQFVDRRNSRGPGIAFCHVPVIENENLIVSCETPDVARWFRVCRHSPVRFGPEAAQVRSFFLCERCQTNIMPAADRRSSRPQF
jgi:hypothetical protein